MKNVYLFLLFVALGIALVPNSPIIAAQAAPTTEFEKFVVRYAPPAALKKHIERDARVVYASPGVVKDCPAYHKKDGDLSRIINAERMRRYFSEHNLDDCLDVPKKYLCKIHDKWTVFAETVRPGQSAPLTLTQVQQLTTFAQLTRFWDWDFGNNWMRNEQGKLVCIDTEDASFIPRDKSDFYASHIISKLLSWKQSMNSDAAEWLKNRIAELKQDPQTDYQTTSLATSTRYDDPSIDFEKVKQELKEAESRKRVAAFSEDEGTPKKPLKEISPNVSPIKQNKSPKASPIKYKNVPKPIFAASPIPPDSDEPYVSDSD